MIPKKIKVGGIIYKVIECDNLFDKRGLIDYSKDIIYLDKTLSRGQKLNALIHEVSHAINPGWSEATVEMVAFAFTQIIMDNRFIK